MGDSRDVAKNKKKKETAKKDMKGAKPAAKAAPKAEETKAPAKSGKK